MWWTHAYCGPFWIFVIKIFVIGCLITKFTKRLCYENLELYGIHMATFAIWFDFFSIVRTHTCTHTHTHAHLYVCRMHASASCWVFHCVTPRSASRLVCIYYVNCALEDCTLCVLCNLPLLFWLWFRIYIGRLMTQLFLWVYQIVFSCWVFCFRSVCVPKSPLHSLFGSDLPIYAFLILYRGNLGGGVLIFVIFVTTLTS